MPKVARFHQLGGPEVLQIDEIAFEDPAAGELLLKVSAIGINRMEIFFRSGGFGQPKTFPAVLGSECAGAVLAIGQGVTGFAIGDRVATIPGFTTVPGFSTEAYVPAEITVKLPDGISFLKVVVLKSLGIEYIIITDKQDITTEVARITGGVGCRVIYNPVAGKGISKLLNILAVDRVILIYGILDLAPASIDPVKGLAKFATIKFTAVFRMLLNPEKRAMITEFVLKGVADGVLKPIIDKKFSFKDIAEAHRYVESNQHVGKVVVTV
ncbi:chaperonin 10-like protein [Ilyonectria robusta]|uniref:chaperonin 10-like protein n=1 Tax=Ilyonectria robusta TaxID=1079257 RepID=UPI001E8D406C|nr:chaperonin 10-like protein [Ilyonectria robusta]KAH8684062.1 chaperonin 10-like protein [Ilyonectria robusta]